MLLKFGWFWRELEVLVRGRDPFFVLAAVHVLVVVAASTRIDLNLGENR